VLTYLQVMAKSSNIGTAKAARLVGAPALHASILNFGFGALTLVPLPGEVTGRVRPLKSWQPMSLTRVPIGQELTATPLQMVLAYGAIANRGVWMPPRLVSHFSDASGAVVAHYPADPPRTVLGERGVQEVTTALKAVVSPEGTGKRAILEHYSVAGKTGTAQKIVGGTYSNTKYYASFIGWLPADRPEICILVGVDEPDKRPDYEGGAVAAPAFALMAERIANYLRIEPDLAPEPARPGPDQPSELVVSRSLAANRAAHRPAAALRR
jgi:cell division protein FtsI/penicillin-binding protein 2